MLPQVLPQILPLTSNPDCNPECRACHYKEFDYPEQLTRKQKWADTQLARWADRLAPIEPAPESERLGYRTKSWLWSFTEDSGLSLGLSFGLSFGMIRSRRAGTRWEKEFVSWNTCPLHSQPIREMMTRLREVLVEKAPEFTKTALAGVWFGNPHLVIVARQDALDLMKQIEWSKLLVAPFDRAWFHLNTQVGAKVFGHRPLVQLSGPPLEASHPVRAFRQVAHSLLQQARSLALSHLLSSSPAQVLDLYCGTGELSQGLPAEVEWIGIEHSKEAIEFAMSLQKTGRRVHRGFVGAVEQRLADPSVLQLIRSPYALYLNPPRSGLTPDAREQVMRLLKTQPAGSISYLSCSASSLSRDLVFLEECGYRVESLRSFDFFPQTEHFETLANLTPFVNIHC
jgi:tRNA/tmRNA/rRNA uracil-C5-methylase (TrmA/RlmC/RlmD family)